MFNWDNSGNWWDILLFILFAAITVVSAYAISLIVNQIEKKSKLSSSFLSGILLSFMTALPELICSIVVAITYMNENDDKHSIGLAIGDLLGGNFLNMIFLTIAIGFTFKSFKHFKITKPNLVNCISLSIAYVLIAVSMLMPQKVDDYLMLGHSINIASIIILLIFIVNTFIMTRKQEEKEEPNEVFDAPKQYRLFDKLNVKQLFLSFAGIGIILGGSAIGVTIAADNVVEFIGMSSTGGGALFLGIATSLPELITLITLLKMKNYNAAVSEILGSAVMSLLIIVIVDLIYQGGSKDDGNIYHGFTEDKVLACLCLFSFLCVSTVIITKFFQKKQSKKINIMYITLLSLSCLTYIGYIVSIFTVKS